MSRYQMPTIQFPKMLRDIFPEGEIVHTSKVVHVTFYICKLPYPYDDEERYKLFSESEKDGAHELDPCDYVHNYNDHFESYEEATSALAIAQTDLENTLERKREGWPTQKQLMFFFRNQMPIPLDLTWGQASDAIEEKLHQIAKDKQTARVERFHGFVEGDKVTFPWVTFEQIGEEKYQRKAIMKKGTIAKLHQAGKAGKIAYVEVGYTTYHVRDFKTMQKIEGEIKP